MSKTSYIGGAFCSADMVKIQHETTNWEQFFPTTFKSYVRSTFETGIDALAAILKIEDPSEQLSVYFPLHYCQESIDRLLLKCPAIRIERYESVSNLPDIPCVIIWNHFNAYCELPSSLLDHNNWIVIEDFVQSAQNILQLKSHAGFTSLRKWSPIDLALVYFPEKITLGNEGESEYHLLKKQAERLKTKWVQTNDIKLETEFLNTFVLAEEKLKQNKITKASAEDVIQFEAQNWSKIFAIRAENAAFLKQELSKLKIHFLIQDDLFCMISLKNRDEIRTKLREKGIFAPIHWLDSNDQKLANELLSLPIDQRYDLEDMQRIIDELKHALKN